MFYLFIDAPVLFVNMTRMQLYRSQLNSVRIRRLGTFESSKNWKYWRR